MEKAFEALVDLFDHLIYDAQGQMFVQINCQDKDLRISAPQFIIDLFMQALSYKYLMSQPSGQMGKDLIYKGLTFVPCYELEIAVWHKDYPLFKEEWMLRKLPLNSPFVVHGDMYKKYIIDFEPLIKKFMLPTQVIKN